MLGKKISLNSYFKYGEVSHHWTLPRGRDMVVFDLKNVLKEKCWQFCQTVDGDWFESDSIATVVFDNGEEVERIARENPRRTLMNSPKNKDSPQVKNRLFL